MFPIEKNIPLPPERKNSSGVKQKTCKYAQFLLELKVGDSFLIPEFIKDGEKTVFCWEIAGSFRAVAKTINFKLRTKRAKKPNGKGNGIRIWRVY